MRRSALIAAATLAGHAARADGTTTAALNWVRLPGAESCISPQGLARAVEARLGRPVLTTLSRADWALEGRVERRGGAWVATLSASRGEGGAGARTVQSTAPDCAALDPQILVVVTLLLDSAGALVEPTTPPAPPAPLPPAAAPCAPARIDPPPAVAPPAQPAPPPAARRAQVELGAGAAVAWSPAFVPTLHAAVTWWPAGPIVRLRTELGAALPSTASHEDAAVSYASVHAGVSACAAHPRFDRLALCAGLIAALHRSEGSGPGAEGERWSVGLTAPVRVRLEAPLAGRWSVIASLGASAHLAWPRWVIAGVDGQVARDLGPAPLSFLADVATGYAW